MPRNRSAPKPKPAASGGGRSYSSNAAPPRAAPPPAAPQYAPAPAPQQGGGGMMGGLMGTMATGMALGTGSAIAHRAVDGVMGAFSGGGEQQHHTQAAPPPPPQPYQQPAQPCAEQAKRFSECMSQYGGDMNACQMYFDAMQQCKMTVNTGFQ